jgi:hypothetical protein
MKRRSQLTIAAIALLGTFAAMAQEIYKSVDAQGRVTFSSSPPPGVPGELVQKVKIPPGPTEEQRQEAAQRAKEIERMLRAEEQPPPERLEEARAVVPAPPAPIVQQPREPGQLDEEVARVLGLSEPDPSAEKPAK